MTDQPLEAVCANRISMKSRKFGGVGGIGRPSRPILTGSTGVRSLNLNAWSEHEADL